MAVHKPTAQMPVFTLRRPVCNVRGLIEVFERQERQPAVNAAKTKDVRIFLVKSKAPTKREADMLPIRYRAIKVM